jgi:glyoxylase-like metal-dependent hydrolase (beta-lactamase superfamily II)
MTVSPTTALTRLEILVAFLAGMAAFTAIATPVKAEPYVESYTGSLDGLYANSHLIVSRGEAVLVDAQLTRSDARAVIEMVERSEAMLKMIFVTHAHPDHYLGLEELKRKFPRTRVFTSQLVAVEIAANGEKARRFWHERLGEDIADAVIIPQAMQTTRFTVGGESLRVIEIIDGESEFSAALYIPKSDFLFSGDLIFSGIHPWLVENRPREWRRNLAVVRQIGDIDMVYSGHGTNGGSGMFDRLTAYLTRYSETIAVAQDADQAFATMIELYPAYALPHYLRLSTESAFDDR